MKIGISTKLVLFVGSALLLSFAVTTAVVASYARKIERDSITQTMASQNNELATIITSEFGNGVAIAQSMRDMFELAANNPEARISRKMLTDSVDAMLDMSPGILGVWYNFEPNSMGYDRRYIDKDNPTGGFNYYIGFTGEGGAKEYQVTSYDANYSEEYYVVPVSTKTMVVTNPYIDGEISADSASANLLISSVAFPVFKDNSPIGVVGVDISAVSLGKSLQSINKKNNMYAALIAADGTIVAHKYPELVGKRIATDLQDARKDVANRNLSRAMINELIVSPEMLASIKDATPHSESTFSAKMHTKMLLHKGTITLGVGINQRHWALISAVDEAVAYSAADKIIQSLLVAHAFSFVLILCCVFAAGRYIAKPIREVSRKIIAAASGDFTQKLKVNSDDELGKLCENFNCLTNNTHALLKAIKDKSIALTQTTERAKKNVGTAENAMGIAADIEKVKISDKRRRLVGIDAGYENNVVPENASLLAQQLKILTDKFNVA